MMLNFRHGVRIFISTEPTDMRKGFDGLSVIVEHHWGTSPLSGWSAPQKLVHML